MDLTFLTESGTFNYRVAAVILSRGRLLAMHDERSPYFYLPGGRVQLHETAEAAVEREVFEELGVSCRIRRPLWFCQSFFTEEVSQKRYHELCFYFLVEAGPLPEERFNLDEGVHKNRFEWLPFEQLKNEHLYPTFIKESIFDLPENLTIVTELE